MQIIMQHKNLRRIFYSIKPTSSTEGGITRSHEKMSVFTISTELMLQKLGLLYKNMTSVLAEYIYDTKLIPRQSVNSYIHKITFFIPYHRQCVE